MLTLVLSMRERRRVKRARKDAQLNAQLNAQLSGALEQWVAQILESGCRRHKRLRANASCG